MKIFYNRKEAGLLLGEHLAMYKNSHPIILALPRGGVETGYYTALKLDCELSVLVCRKLGYPKQPEAAFGAIAEDGSLYLSPWVKNKLSRDDIIKVKSREAQEVERRAKRYRKGKPMPNLHGKTVILVDDGIATGATMFAAIEMCIKQQPEKLIVAVPVAGTDMKEKLLKKVDDVVILTIPDPYYSVSQVYEKFDSVEDEEVIRFLNNNEVIHNFSNTLAMIL